ncbi:MAG: Rpn family recombination-promoting nuclease/putative transposase [Bacteroidota bacterium]
MEPNKKLSYSVAHQPHDSLFKKGMTDIEVAQDLLQKYLPHDLRVTLDWGTLRHTNRSSVKEHLAQIHADMVYQCTLQHSHAHVYALVEHQSTPNRLLPFRIIQYDLALIGQHLDEGYTQLPIVVNICVYASKQTPYPYSIDLHDCFEDPALARKHMSSPFKLILVDLTTISEDELAQHGRADLLQILLKRGAQGGSFIPWVKSNPDMVLKLLERSYGISGVHYMLSLEDQDRGQELLEAIASTVPKKKEEIMTAGQYLWNEGMECGMERGIEQGMERGVENSKLTIAKTMLQDNLPREQISKWTGLDLAQIDRISGHL